MTRTAALEFLLTRRSRPAKLMTGPVPDRAELELLLTAASRVPDHGKLAPWRFVVLQKPALTRLAGEAGAYAEAAGLPPEKAEKGVGQFARSPLCVAVIASPVVHDKIPEIEQVLCAGGVCLSLVNAALASGWGASWLTGWVALDRGFAAPAFGLTDREFVAGLIHIGSYSGEVADRPRPDPAALTTWVEA